jgi:hypothetical protein
VGDLGSRQRRQDAHQLRPRRLGAAHLHKIKLVRELNPENWWGVTTDINFGIYRRTHMRRVLASRTAADKMAIETEASEERFGLLSSVQ